MNITLESPRQPDIERLVQALDAYQIPLYPAESHHGVDLESLAAPDALFAVARDDDGVAIACGAMLLAGERGELKRFYTVPAHRGRGVAKALLAFLEAECSSRGCLELALETGIRQPEAVAFYARSGYAECGPFGNYVDDPNSVFMRKTLTPEAS